MGGIAAAAYYDLAMRSCPPGLQGTLMMMVDGVNQLSYRGGDVLGSQDLRQQPGARLPLLRDRHDGGLRPDPAGDAADSRAI